MKKWLLSITLVIPALAMGQTPFLGPHAIFVNPNTGIACVGCALYSYAAGTTSAQPTYVDNTITTQNPNPVVLGTDGGANIWLGTSPYKFALYTAPIGSGGVLIWTVDNVSLPFLPLTGATVTGPLIAPVASINGAINPMQPPYNAKCDGSTDDSIALQAAITAVQGSPNAVILIPSGKNCKFGTTLTISGNLTVTGIRSQNDATIGSKLTYTGTSDAFVVGTVSNYSYFVDFLNISFNATSTATSLVRFYGINGPSSVAHNIFNGNGTAVSAVIYDNPGAGLQTINADNLYAGFTGNEVVAKAMTNILIEANQFFNTSAAGLFLDDPEDAEVKNNYFELMLYGIELVNNTEQHFKVNIHDNRIKIDQQPPLSSPTRSANERCILVKSTTNAQPFYGEGSIRDNTCFLSYLNGGILTQGPAPYGIDFQTASNAFYVNQKWEIENNTINGVTTAGINNDNANVSIAHRDTQTITVWTPGSSAPTYLPNTAGAGTFSTLMTTTPTQGPRIGSAEYDWQHVYDTYTSGAQTGTLKLTLPSGKRWSNSQATYRITGFNFTANSSWQIIVGGENASAGPAWVFGTAAIVGTPPFGSVRLADDGTLNCILLGTTSTTWFNPAFSVDVLTNDSSGWQGTWTTSYLASETGITVSFTPTISQTISNNVIPQTVTGFHGNSSGVKVQGSDGTGASGNYPKYDAGGNLTDSGNAVTACTYGAINFCTTTSANGTWVHAWGVLTAAGDTNTHVFTVTGVNVSADCTAIVTSATGSVPIYDSSGAICSTGSPATITYQASNAGISSIGWVLDGKQ